MNEKKFGRFIKTTIMGEMEYLKKHPIKVLKFKNRYWYYPDY